MIPEFWFILGTTFGFIGAFMLGLDVYFNLFGKFKFLITPIRENGKVKEFLKYDYLKNDWGVKRVKITKMEKRVLTWISLIILGFILQIIGYIISLTNSIYCAT